MIGRSTAARHRVLADRRQEASRRTDSRAAKGGSWSGARDVRPVSRDTLKGPRPSENDTQVEPSIAVDPNDPSIVVGVVQQGRFEDGGSVDPGYVVSHDGGSSWTKGDLPHLTVAVGGHYSRASDPVVAIGPDGTVYAQTLGFSVVTCENAVVVQRSTDHGLTFEDPVVIETDDDCISFNDKNWIAVDSFPASPHYGRLYAVWDQEHHSFQGEFTGAPVLLRYSDDHGLTWSDRIPLTGPKTYGLGALPEVQPNGDLTVLYQKYLPDFSMPPSLVALTSHDGGLTYDPPVTIDFMLSSEPEDMRTGALPAAAVDPVTGYLYAVWQDTRTRGDGFNDIVLARSRDGGGTWTPARRVDRATLDGGLDHVTPAVAAYGGRVWVTYLVRNYVGGPSHLVFERIALSVDDGATFGPAQTLGPPIDLDFAATVSFDGTKFLGDYMGVAASNGSGHALWCRSSKWRTGGSGQHQTTWTATVDA